MKQPAPTNEISRTVGPIAAALALGMLGVVGFHLALFSSGFDRIPGDEGDARTAVYFVEHWYQVFQGRAEALSPGMFYPVKGSLAYTDTMLLHALPYALLRQTGLDMFSSLAVPLVLFSFLNYACCFYLLYRVLGLNVIASCVGALFFAFNSPRLNHTGHLNFQASFFLPLALTFVMRFVQQAESLTQWRAFRLLASAAVCVNLQLVISLHQGWFLFFWSFLFCVLALSLRSTRRAVSTIIGRFWPALMGGAVLLVLGALPLLAIYAPAARVLGSRPYGLVKPLIPEVWSLLQMGSGNYVWGGVSASLSRLHPLPSIEHNIGIGLVASVAWLILTVWAFRTVMGPQGSDSPGKSGPDVSSLFFALTILATTLFYAIGMSYGSAGSPWRIVYLAFPGAGGLRAVARYVMLLSLPMAIVFAVVLHRWIQHLSIRQIVLERPYLRTALFAGITVGLVEQFGRTPAFSSSAELVRLRRLAATLPEGCAAFYAAAAPDRRRIKYEYQIDAMLISSMRNVPTLNGYSGHVPPDWALREVEAPDYEQRIAQWIERRKLTGRVCRLEIGD